MKPYPKCGEQIKDTLKFCVYCGCNIAQEEEKNKTKFCGECGAELMPGMKFCGECGAKVGASAKADPWENAGQNDDPWAEVMEEEKSSDPWADFADTKEGPKAKQTKEPAQKAKAPQQKATKTTAKKTTSAKKQDSNAFDDLSFADELFTELFGAKKQNTTKKQEQKKPAEKPVETTEKKPAKKHEKLKDKKKNEKPLTAQEIHDMVKSIDFSAINWDDVEHASEKSKNWADECIDAGKQAEANQDYDTAMDWYQKAVEEDDSRAMGLIGDLYQYGRGVEVDLEEALEWYKKGDLCGDGYCRNQIGVMYYYGKGVKQDLEKAFSFFEKGAYTDKKCANAYVNLGFCYENGYGTSKDVMSAGENFRLAAELGNAWAQNKVGQMYLFTDYGFFAEDEDDFDENGEIERDYASAKKWFETAINNGYAAAYANLAYMYYNGLGVKKDGKKAFELTKKGVEKEPCANSQYNLGYYYEKGIGTKKDIKKAKEWYKKAADAGSTQAKERLAKLG